MKTFIFSDPYKSNYRGKGTFDSDYPDRGKEYSGPLYEPNGHVGGTRPKVRLESG